jgi:hypothetical protein
MRLSFQPIVQYRPRFRSSEAEPAPEPSVSLSGSQLESMITHWTKIAPGLIPALEDGALTVSIRTSRSLTQQHLKNFETLGLHIHADPKETSFPRRRVFTGVFREVARLNDILATDVIQRIAPAEKLKPN